MCSGYSGRRMQTSVWNSGGCGSFYLSDSGFSVDWSAHDPQDVARIMEVRDSLSIPSALVVANPLPESEQLDPDVHDQVLEEGLRLASQRNITGKDVTPFLLDHFHRATHGASLVVNEQIILRNAELAAQIAVADATQRAAARR